MNTDHLHDDLAREQRTLDMMVQAGHAMRKSLGDQHPDVIRMERHIDKQNAQVAAIRLGIESARIEVMRRPAALPLGLTKRVTAEVIPFPSISFDHSPEAA